MAWITRIGARLLAFLRFARDAGDDEGAPPWSTLATRRLRKMLSSTHQHHRQTRTRIALAVCLALAACSDRSSGAQRSSGGENALDRAGRDIDAAHRNFKRAVRPAARAVDEKSREVVDEGKKAVDKTVRAIDRKDPASEH